MDSTGQHDKEPTASLAGAFREDLLKRLKTIPGVSVEIEQSKAGKTPEISLDAGGELRTAAVVIGLLLDWVGTLASEIDRLRANLEQQPNSGQDLDS